MKIQLIPFEVLIFLTCAVVSACGVFERHPDSGYSRASAPQMIKRSQVTRAAGPQNIETKARLKQLENSIATKKELEQYSRVLPYLKDEDERIAFLSLPNFEEKQKFLRDQNLDNRTVKAHEDYRELIEAQDIGLGMTQNLVRKSWGEPDNIDVSGNPQFRNERWRYNKYVSTPDGYKPEKKIVYFEGGRVVGWEVE